jgi:hypothetical protein
VQHVAASLQAVEHAKLNINHDMLMCACAYACACDNRHARMNHYGSSELMSVAQLMQANPLHATHAVDLVLQLFFHLT